MQTQVRFVPDSIDDHQKQLGSSTMRSWRLAQGDGSIAYGNGKILALIYFVAIALRVASANLPDPGFYPDDVFQTLEPAHKLAFGYGLTSWEYDVGLRNWALPGLIGLFLKGLAGLGLSDPVFYEPIISACAICLSLTLVETARRTARLLAGDLAGTLAAATVAIFPACVVAAQKFTPEIVAGYSLAAALYFSLLADRRSAAWSGLMCGITVGLRMHYAPALAAICLFVYYCRGRDVASFLLAICSGAAVFAVFGVVDWISWGIPFYSYYIAVEINIIMGISAYFGTSPWYSYFLIFKIEVAYLIISLYVWPKSKYAVIPALVIFIVHSAIGHKESRFLFAIHEPILVGISIFLATMLERRKVSGPIGFAAVVVLPVLAMVVGQYAEVKALRTDMVQVVKALRQQSDIRALGVYNVNYYWFTGMYSLHRDIPVVFKSARLNQQLQVDPGITHIIVSRSTPPIQGFKIVSSYRDLEIRKRDLIDNSMPLPATDGRLPLKFSWSAGLSEE